MPLTSPVFNETLSFNTQIKPLIDRAVRLCEEHGIPYVFAVVPENKHFTCPTKGEGDDSTVKMVCNGRGKPEEVWMPRQLIHGSMIMMPRELMALMALAKMGGLDLGEFTKDMMAKMKTEEQSWPRDRSS